MRVNQKKLLGILAGSIVSILFCSTAVFAISGYIPSKTSGSYGEAYVVNVSNASSTYGLNEIILNQVDGTGIGNGEFNVASGGNISTSGTLYVHSLSNSTTDASACYNSTTKEITYNVADTCIASLRDLKSDVRDLDVDANKVMGLEPVRFDWKSNGNESIGLIAEDVERIMPELATYGVNGDLFGVDYSKLSVILLDMVQKQQREIDLLKNVISRKPINYCPLYKF